jgi:hypothetical protein
LYAHKNSIDIELLGDNNNWYKWLVLKPSNIPRAGNGLFTARAFLDSNVITKYLGNVTSRPEKVNPHKVTCKNRKWHNDNIGTVPTPYNIATRNK